MTMKTPTETTNINDPTGVLSGRVIGRQAAQ
jgi:hypothetical protein